MDDERLDQGIFVFSWDFELAWGFHDHQQLPERFHKYDSRAYIGELIKILEQHAIPSTWATVGHLLLNQCNQTESRPYTEIRAPTDRRYDSDPCTSVQEDLLWYAPDLIARLRSCTVTQEIGSHTFSHVMTNIDEKILMAELAACRNIANETEMRTFVSPRHGKVPVKLLSEYGYTSYREPSTNPSWRQAIRFYTGIDGPKTDIPTREPGGVWRHPVSTYFFYNPVNVVQRRFKRIKRRWFEIGLQRAVANGEVFHVWAHPHNFIGDEDALDQFRWLINRVAELRDVGDIEPMTMRQLTERLEESV